MNFGRGCSRLLMTTLLTIQTVAQCPYDEHQSTQTGETLQCRADKTHWTITAPDVHKRLTEYPAIRFRAGDTITITAGGCVNMDRAHANWKSYVHPQNVWWPWSRGADLRDFGLIWIPGAEVISNGHRLKIPLGSGPVPISNALNVDATGKNRDGTRGEYRVSEDVKDSYLRLGYETDNRDKGWRGEYEELNYSGRPPRRCTQKGSDDGRAWVDIQIRHAEAHSTVETGGNNEPINVEDERLGLHTRLFDIGSLRPFDVVSSSLDSNGILLNPQWAQIFSSPTHEQLSTSGRCASFPYKNPLKVTRITTNYCTRQASFDIPHYRTVCSLGPVLGRLTGHVNWAPATFVGQLEFHRLPDKSKQLETFSGDGDVDLHLSDISGIENIRPILTSDSQASGSDYKDILQLEFADQEVTKYTTVNDGELNDFKYPRCPAFHCNRAKNYEAAKLADEFEGRTAIVTGLLGVDCVHYCHTELHPVYAFAARTRLEKDPLISQDDKWVVFVRNQGNEGSCAQDRHFLDEDSFTLFLPAPKSPAESALVPELVQEALFSNCGSDAPTCPPERPIAFQSTREGAFVTFRLKSKADQHIFASSFPPMVRSHGYLRIRWVSPSNVPIEPQEFYAKPEIGITEPKWTNRNFFGKLYSLKDYYSPTFGVIEGFDKFQNLADVTLGIHTEQFVTSLGAVEGEVLWGVPHSAASPSGLQYDTHMKEWLVGADIVFGIPWVYPSLPDLFINISGGQSERSAKSIHAAEPFDHFYGKPNAINLGLGYTFRRSNKFSYRVFLGDLYTPSTNDHTLRFTFTEQLKLHRQIQ